MGDSLARLAGDLGLGDVEAVGRVFRVWDEVVGGPIAAHAHPVRLRDGVLLVHVDEAGWATELRYVAEGLADRLNEAVGAPAVTSVQVAVQPREPGRR